MASPGGHKTAPPPGGHVFSLITTIFKLVQDIHITNAKYVTSRTCFLSIKTIFELNLWSRSLTKVNRSRDGYELCNFETNVLTKFHEDWAKNVSYKLFTCFHYIHIEKTAPPPGGHVFPPIMTIFELFHDDWEIIGTSRVFTRNTAPPPDGYASNVTSTVFTTFELSRGINGTNVLTKFHEDQTTRPSLLYVLFYGTADPNCCQNEIKIKDTDDSRFGANQPTNRPTDQPTDQQTGQKQYVPHYYSGGHKKIP
ncbi:hypothetical protein DPMN_011489 [Dreissena polymorpha]|uniref:Uncharacterized protein n=1 Tax=Dreissena polymorpha TaxID=45954 RepID=A0A9D4N679_DREPO|nr:hypothetical protein DPMN_011489 [Dreissena polymorpha]